MVRFAELVSHQSSRLRRQWPTEQDLLLAELRRVHHLALLTMPAQNLLLEWKTFHQNRLKDLLGKLNHVGRIIDIKETRPELVGPSLDFLHAMANRFDHSRAESQAILRTIG